MLNRSSFLALAAITTLGVAALAPTSASAFGGHGGATNTKLAWCR